MTSHISPDVVFAFFFFFNDTATTEIYTLSLHDALPILAKMYRGDIVGCQLFSEPGAGSDLASLQTRGRSPRSEEHTSELQSLAYLVCRLLLEKKKKVKTPTLLHPLQPPGSTPSTHGVDT